MMFGVCARQLAAQAALRPAANLRLLLARAGWLSSASRPDTNAARARQAIWRFSPSSPPPSRFANSEEQAFQPGPCVMSMPELFAEAKRREVRAEYEATDTSPVPKRDVHVPRRAGG